MTELLYLTDAYVKQFAATVIDRVDGGVILDRTAFYPGGGGQPCDFGTLTAGDVVWNVSKVKKVAGKIVHYVGDGLMIGTTISAKLDWERRYQLMRTHTAMHVLCGVIWRDYGASVTGGNMDPLKGRMDFEFETMRQELVKEIETAVNREVVAARDTQVKILPPRRGIPNTRPDSHQD